jgi:hypothetical protein
MTKMVDIVNQRLQEAGLVSAQAVFIPPEDRLQDASIEIRIAGVATSLEIQCGPGQYSLNRYVFKDGKLEEVKRVSVSNNFFTIVDALIFDMTSEAIKRF